MNNISNTALDMQFFASDISADVVPNILKEVVTNPYFTNLDEKFCRKIQHCLDISEQTPKFIEEIGFHLSPLQRKVINQTAEDQKMRDGFEMISGGIVGQFLKITAKIAKAEHFLDIGTYTGFSAVTMAETKFCKNVTSLDINEYSKVFVDCIVKGSSIEGKIDVLIGNALQSLHKLKDTKKTFDFVFIDADKVGYLDYYKFILDNKLLNPNGLIICDNILWSNDTITKRQTDQGKTLYEFAHFVKCDTRVEQLIIPYRDGLLIVKLVDVC